MYKNYLYSNIILNKVQLFNYCTYNIVMYDNHFVTLHYNYMLMILTTFQNKLKLEI
jgi:hypothetical protein